MATKKRFKTTKTPTLPQPFYGPFSATTRVSRCQKRTPGLYGARQTHWPSGWAPSILTNQCPPAPSPIFYRPDALPAAQPTVSKHWRLKQQQKQQCKNVLLHIYFPLTDVLSRVFNWHTVHVRECREDTQQTLLRGWLSRRWCSIRELDRHTETLWQFVDVGPLWAGDGAVMSARYHTVQHHITLLHTPPFHHAPYQPHSIWSPIP